MHLQFERGEERESELATSKIVRALIQNIFDSKSTEMNLDVRTYVRTYVGYFCDDILDDNIKIAIGMYTKLMTNSIPTC